MENQKIISALVRVMEEVGFIGKENKNQQQGYKFRGIDDVYNAVQPALVKHGVIVAPRYKDLVREERTTKAGGLLIYTTIVGEFLFYCMEDGSSIAVTTIGEGMDSSDKSTNKAMSAAYKYAIFQALCIPTEAGHGGIDSENETPQPEPEKPLTAAQGKAILELAARNSGLSGDDARTVIDWYCLENGRTYHSGKELITEWDKIYERFLDHLEKCGSEIKS